MFPLLPLRHGCFSDQKLYLKPQFQVPNSQKDFYTRRSCVPSCPTTASAEEAVMQRLLRQPNSRPVSHSREALLSPTVTVAMVRAIPSPRRPCRNIQLENNLLGLWPLTIDIAKKPPLFIIFFDLESHRPLRAHIQESLSTTVSRSVVLHALMLVVAVARPLLLYMTRTMSDSGNASFIARNSSLSSQHHHRPRTFTTSRCQAVTDSGWRATDDTAELCRPRFLAY